jgi:hypothetical protein
MAHPSRSEYAEALAARLKVPIVYDPEPDEERNPWRCARQAWKVASSKQGATHAMVIQEDVICRDDLLKHVRRALRAKPDRAVSFFLGWLPSQTAQLALSHASRCAAWVPGAHAGWCPTIALAMPRWMGEQLAAFDDGTRPVADDDVAGRYLRELGTGWYATIPSLVDHDDDAPSLMSMGTRNRGAMCYLGHGDPTRINWNAD